MNTELKAMLSVIFAMVKFVMDVVEKQGVTQDIADLTPIMTALPTIVSGYSTIVAEMEALNQPANLQDLLAFIGTEFAGLESNEKAQAILTASLKLASDLGTDGYALYQAIKG